MIDQITTVQEDLQDDFFILSSSWEKRCLGVAQRTKLYKSSHILINVYDNKTAEKEAILKELTETLKGKGEIKKFTNRHSDPISGILHMMHYIKERSLTSNPRISLDISCFTRKHLLQLLSCLECNNLLGNTNFYYTQPTDYFDEHNNSAAIGIKAINEIETFAGENLSSRDTILLLFLNFEGARANSLWSELQPHKTIPIVPFPSIKAEWDDKVRDNNKLLLSTLNISWESEFIKRSAPLDPDSTKDLLTVLINSKTSNKEYNYIVTPLGTKAQVLGIYKYWRLFPFTFSIIYPSPMEYKTVPIDYPAEKVYLIDKSSTWERITN